MWPPLSRILTDVMKDIRHDPSLSLSCLLQSWPALTSYPTWGPLRPVLWPCRGWRNDRARFPPRTRHSHQLRPRSESPPAVLGCGHADVCMCPTVSQTHSKHAMLSRAGGVHHVWPRLRVGLWGTPPVSVWVSPATWTPAPSETEHASVWDPYIPDWLLWVRWPVCQTYGARFPPVCWVETAGHRIRWSARTALTAGRPARNKSQMTTTTPTSTSRWAQGSSFRKTTTALSMREAWDSLSCPTCSPTVSSTSSAATEPSGGTIRTPCLMDGGGGGGGGGAAGGGGGGGGRHPSRKTSGEPTGHSAKPLLKQYNTSYLIKCI